MSEKLTVHEIKEQFKKQLTETLKAHYPDAEINEQNLFDNPKLQPIVLQAIRSVRGQGDERVQQAIDELETELKSLMPNEN